MGSVNKLSYRINGKKTLGREIYLCIDNRSLVELLSDAFFNYSNGEKWLEQRDSRLDLKELKKSIKQSGFYSILICAHCKMIEDLMLQRFEIIHHDKYIIWNVKPPGAEIYFSEFEVLQFKFDFMQYQTVISELSEDKMMRT